MYEAAAIEPYADAQAEASPARTEILLTATPIVHPSDTGSANAGFLLHLPPVESLDEARSLVRSFAARKPQHLLCNYLLDQRDPALAESQILTAGVIALAIGAGHRATLFMSGANTPEQHWRSAFVFRAVQGVHRIKPKLARGKVVELVTGAIHFRASGR